MTATNVSFEPQIGAFVIESLTLGMYGESRNAIREYVQNGFDALRHAIREGLIAAGDARIDVELDVNGVTIRDNGGGLRTENAADVLTAIGASNKSYRQDAGFRGIGRLAGIVFCDELVFTTKAKGQTRGSRVLFKAKLLRERLSPEGGSEKDAVETLRDCVEATQFDHADPDAHFFEVRLKGLHNPPAECIDPAAMRTFLESVAPLPFSPDFPFGAEITARAAAAGLPVETVRLFLKDGDAGPTELFKPYSADLSVKRERAPITGIAFEASPTGKWFGWIARKRVPGAVKDPFKGIRVRVRNIQIDDTRVMREIFAVSNLTDKPGGSPRGSYIALSDWYVGEVFVDPSAAIPNARRDGFEENDAWLDMRNELDRQIATPFGKQAYKTSKANKISVENLTKEMDELQGAVELAEAEVTPTVIRVQEMMRDASSLRTRLGQALNLSEPDEIAPLQALAGRLGDLQRRLEVLLAQAPEHSCEEEIAEAVDGIARQLLRAFRDRLGPQEWQRARAIVSEVTGVKDF